MTTITNQTSNNYTIMEATYFGSYGELSKYVDRNAVEQMTREASKIITEQISKNPIIETKPQQKNK